MRNLTMFFPFLTRSVVIMSHENLKLILKI